MMTRAGLTLAEAAGGPLGAGGRGGALRAISANAWATIAGTESGSRPFSLRLYLTAIADSISCTTAMKVSITPSPRAATAGKTLRPQGLSDWSSSWRGISDARSCLLYWNTSGTFSGTRRLARRFTFMFSKAAWFSLAIGRLLSATNTTASAPASTTRRVALYCTWPGTV